MARQGLLDRSASLSWGLIEVADRNVEGLEDLDELFGREGGLPKFDLRESALGDAEDFSQVSLGETTTLPEVA